MHGSVQVAGGRVLIDGPEGADVQATAGGLELGPIARIATRGERGAGERAGKGGRSGRERPAATVLLGFLLLASLPFALLLLAVTPVGLLLALCLLLAALAPLPPAPSRWATGRLGDWATGRCGAARWRAEQGERRGWRIGAACLAVLVLAALGALPYVGWLADLLALLTGLGALLLLSLMLLLLRPAQASASPG